MNDQNKAELRRLAEAATQFIAAANPAAVLSLLDDNAQLRAEVEALRKDAERWQCVRNAVPMKSPYAVWREGAHVVLGKDADELVDNFLSSAKEGSANVKNNS